MICFLMMVLLLLGLSAGYLISNVLLHSKSSCVLRIDRSIPDEPAKMFLELYEDADSLAKNKYVTLEISTQNYMSQ